MAADPTQRFSDRVENYIRFRPGYPPAILDILCDGIGLHPDHVIADIGSGTGISCELLLKNGNAVFGVEPNPDMRSAAERLLAGYPKFTSVAGRSESTTLPPRSVDLITAFQAFHWFDHDKARAEFLRILRPDGHVVVVWNVRKTAGTPFLEDYEKLLLDFATDYSKVRHENITQDAIARFFAGPFEKRTAANAQRFDLEGVIGRLLSSSYAPLSDHPNHLPMMSRLREIFSHHARDGVVVFEYETEVYFGQLK